MALWPFDPFPSPAARTRALPHEPLTTRQRLRHLLALWSIAHAHAGRGADARRCYLVLRDVLCPPEGSPPMTPAAAAAAAGVSRQAASRWRARFLRDMDASAELADLEPAAIRRDLTR